MNGNMATSTSMNTTAITNTDSDNRNTDSDNKGTC